MPIVSSVIESTDAQKDKRSWIHELHIDHIGGQHSLVYLADQGYDTATALANHAAGLASNATASEISLNLMEITSLGKFATPTLVHSTAAQNVTALRAAYQGATQVEAIMMGDYLNTFTDAQLMNAFGLTQTQVTNLRNNKLIPAAAAADDIRAATGQ